MAFKTVESNYKLRFYFKVRKVQGGKMLPNIYYAWYSAAAVCIVSLLCFTVIAGLLIVKVSDYYRSIDK